MSDKQVESRGILSTEAKITEEISQVTEKIGDALSQPIDLGPILKRWVAEQMPLGSEG